MLNRLSIDFLFFTYNYLRNLFDMSKIILTRLCHLKDEIITVLTIRCIRDYNIKEHK